MLAKSWSILKYISFLNAGHAYETSECLCVCGWKRYFKINQQIARYFEHYCEYLYHLGPFQEAQKINPFPTSEILFILLLYNVESSVESFVLVVGRCCSKILQTNWGCVQTRGFGSPTFYLGDPRIKKSCFKINTR